MLLVQEMVKYEKQNNLHKIRMWRHYLESFPELHRKSVEKIESAASGIRLDQYTARDVVELYEDPCFDDWIKVAFLPTYQGGYERLYARLEQIFDWDRPEYQVLDEERLERTLGNMRRGRYLYLADYDRGDPGLFAVVDATRLRRSGSTPTCLSPGRICGAGRRQGMAAGLICRSNTGLPLGAGSRFCEPTTRS